MVIECEAMVNIFNCTAKQGMNMKDWGKIKNEKDCFFCYDFCCVNLFCVFR